MTAFVLDSSVMLEFLFPDTEENQLYAASVIRHIVEGKIKPIVPQHFHVEIAEFLLRKRRNKAAKFGAAQLKATMRAIEDLGIETRLINYVFTNLVAWSEEFHIQAKDSPFFALAYKMGIPLATLDGGLNQACQSFGVNRVKFN